MFRLKEEIVSYDRVYSADGRKAILTRNIIPSRLLAVDTGKMKKEMSLMEFIWTYGGEKITHSIEEMVPRLARDEEVSLFELPGRVSLIEWNEVFYSYRDDPIGYAVVSFNPEIVKMHLLRKWS